MSNGIPNINRDDLNALREEANELLGSFTIISNEISNNRQALNNTLRVYRNLSGIASQLSDYTSGTARYNVEDLKKLREKYDSQRAILDAQKAALEVSRSQLDTTTAQYRRITEALRTIELSITEVDSAYNAMSGTIDGVINNEESLNRSLGTTGAIAEGLVGAFNRMGLGSISRHLGVQDALENTRSWARETGNVNNFLAVNGKLIQNLGKNLSKSLGPILLLQGLIDIFTIFDKQTTSISKNFGLTSEYTREIRSDLGNMAMSSGDIFIQSSKLVESMGALSDELGFIVDYSGTTLETFTNLNKRFGFSTKESAQLSSIFRLQNKDTEEIFDNLDKSLDVLRNSTNPALNERKILQEIAGTSEDIVVSLGKSPTRLAEAAVKAQALGLSLQKVNQIAANLLNFESSIEAELEAELLTGRAINLEQARLFALTNDISGLTEEIKNNQALINSFATGNRIQQTSIAKALGMSREELAQMVLKQSFLNSLSLSQRETIIAQNKDQFQALTTQEKFNNAVNKLKDLFVNLMEGPLGTFVDILNSILTSTVALGAAFGTTLNIIKSQFTSIGKTLLSVFGKAALKRLPIFGAIISLGIALKEFSNGNWGLGITQLLSGAASFIPGVGPAASVGLDALYGIGKVKSKENQEVQDGMAPSSKGPFTVTDKFGATAVTSEGDNIVVSPNVESKSNVKTEVKSALSRDDLNYLADKIGDKFMEAMNKIEISLDGYKLSSNLNGLNVRGNVPNSYA